MKALYLENDTIGLKDVKKPVPSKNAALIKVLKAGICNTDIELIKGYMNFQGYSDMSLWGRFLLTFRIRRLLNQMFSRFEEHGFWENISKSD